MQDDASMTCLKATTAVVSGGFFSEKPRIMSTLADILEPSVAPKYFLSPRACAGIIRRAAKRGKALPPHLEAALQAVASRLPEEAEKTTATS